jgi:chromate reductase
LTAEASLYAAATVALQELCAAIRNSATRHAIGNSVSELCHHVFTVRAVVTKLIGISGSLRRGSLNTALLRAAAEFVPNGAELTVETIHGIPLYDADVETADGIPERVSALKKAIVAADGLLLATPEYNNSIPGVFKNAVDWLSRPPADIGKVFGGKPVAVLGASPGGFGTVLSQHAWLPVLRTLGTTPWHGGRLLVSRAGSVFDEAGRLASDTTKEQLRQFIEGFVAFVRRVRDLER